MRTTSLIEMETTITTICGIEIEQFKSILLDLETDRNDISIRLELKSEVWTEKFCTVLVFSRQELILSHLATRTIQYINDVNDITSFEIDKDYLILERFKRYHISPRSQSIPNPGPLYG